MTKAKRSKQARYRRAAGKCWNGKVRDVLTAKTSAKARDYHLHRGSYGAASPVRHIDPSEYKS